MDNACAAASHVVIKQRGQGQSTEQCLSQRLIAISADLRAFREIAQIVISSANIVVTGSPGSFYVL